VWSVAWFCLLRVGRSEGVWGTGRVRHRSRDGFRFGGARASGMWRLENAVSSMRVFAMAIARFCMSIHPMHTHLLVVKQLHGVVENARDARPVMSRRLYTVSRRRVSSIADGRKQDECATLTRE
jgi:hypothetical protein